MPMQPNDRIAHLDHARRIVNEHDAAVYLRQGAERCGRFGRIGK
jgi:hypothetical protein